MVTLEKIVSGVNTLPTLPTVYANLSDAMDDPSASLDQLAGIISTDQASAFKILKVANSSLYGFRGKINTISQAILYLGFNEIRSIVFAISVINFFSKSRTLLKFKPVDFWAHSIGVGITTRMIGVLMGQKNLESYFLSGIFHDIGKLLFFEFAPQEYSEVLEMVESKRCSINFAEKEVLGIDHAEAGFQLAKKWELPINIQESIRFHHQGVVDGENDKIIAAVHLGNIITRIFELGYAGDNLIPEPHNEIWQKLKLPENFLHSISDKIIENFNATTRMLLID